MGKPVSFFVFFLGLLAKVFLQSVHHKIEIIIHYSYCEQFHYFHYFLSTNLHLQTTSLRP